MATGEEDARPTPNEQIDRYELRSVIGSGAMGTVYKAYDTTLDRVVAVKTLRKDRAGAPAEEEDWAERFAREACVIAHLNHPNVITLYDYGTDNGQTYLVMEYVEGSNLKEAMKRELFSEDQKISIVCSLCRALAHAHEHGVVHRDIKPENILIAADGRVKLGDFGLATMNGWELTTEGKIIGTPAYLSPEQYHGQKASPQSDIFALGVVAYELLTGRHPFEGSAPAHTMQAVLNHAPPPPHIRRPNVKLGSSLVVLKALAKDPHERYSSALVFLEALQESLAERPDPLLLGFTLTSEETTLLMGLEVPSQDWWVKREEERKLREAEKARVLAEVEWWNQRGVGALPSLPSAQPPKSVTRLPAVQAMPVNGRDLSSEPSLWRAFLRLHWGLRIIVFPFLLAASPFLGLLALVVGIGDYLKEGYDHFAYRRRYGRSSPLLARYLMFLILVPCVLNLSAYRLNGSDVCVAALSSLTPFEASAPWNPGRLLLFCCRAAVPTAVVVRSGADENATLVKQRVSIQVRLADDPEEVSVPTAKVNVYSSRPGDSTNLIASGYIPGTGAVAFYESVDSAIIEVHHLGYRTHRETLSLPKPMYVVTLEPMR